MAEDIKRDINASDKQIADATRVTNVINSLRTDLIQEIDEQLNQMVSTGKPQKLYKQGATKMYGK
jgi:predicted lactoylglutathione lyase